MRLSSGQYASIYTWVSLPRRQGLPQGVEIERREATWCSVIDRESIQRINPQAFKIYTDYAAKEWGSDWDITYTNPTDFPEDGAQACVTSPATLIFDGPAECTTTPVESSHVPATEGSIVDVDYESGTSSATQITIAHPAEFPLNGTVTCDVEVAEIIQSLGNFSLSATVDNSLHSSTSVRKNDLITNRSKATASRGQSCFQPLTNVSCVATGKGKIQIAYEGYLWFNYPTPRSGHYKWAVPLVGFDENPLYRRSTNISLTATISSYAISPDGVPRCLSSDPGSGGSGGSKTHVAAYVAPILAVVAVAAAGMSYWLWRRRRTRRAASSQTGPQTSQLAPSSTQVAQQGPMSPQTSEDEPESLPVYSETS